MRNSQVRVHFNYDEIFTLKNTFPSSSSKFLLIQNKRSITISIPWLRCLIQSKWNKTEDSSFWQTPNPPHFPLCGSFRVYVWQLCHSLTVPSSNTISTLVKRKYANEWQNADEIDTTTQFTPPHLPTCKNHEPKTNQYASAFHAFDFVLINISTLLKRKKWFPFSGS